MLNQWNGIHATLDNGIRRELLLGTANAGHLAHLANESAAAAARSQGPGRALHLELASDCLSASLEQDPLDLAVVRGALALDVHSRQLQPETRAALTVLGHLLERLSGLGPLVREVLSSAGLEARAEGLAARPLGAVLQQLIEDQDLDAAQALLDQLDAAGILPRSGDLAPVALKLQGDLALLSGRLEEAGDRYAQAHARCPELVQERRVEALLRLGRRDEAVAALADLVRRRPWRSNAVLKLFDLLHAHDSGLAPIEDTAILLYTYNHGPDLDRTLASLAAGAAAACPVFVLVNGCTDSTGLVVAKWRGSGAFPRFTSLELPVNVGAPAARNWLLSDPRVQASRYLAFLDDDVVLPPDWLERLFHCRRAYPQAGVWGAKVREHGRAYRLQQVDLNLYYPPRGHQFIGFSDLQGFTPDTGQFDYMRPCASVTGCCHLFPAEVFQRVGGFDIRFSPSQYDDFDHSLRLIQAGLFAAYTGHLAVDHLRVSGAAAALNNSALGNVMGNIRKLEGKYDEPARQAIVEAMDGVLLGDLQRKLAILSRVLPKA